MNEGLLQFTEIDPAAEEAARASEAADPAFSFVDPFAETDPAS